MTRKVQVFKQIMSSAPVTASRLPLHPLKLYSRFVFSLFFFSPFGAGNACVFHAAFAARLSNFLTNFPFWSSRPFSAFVSFPFVRCFSRSVFFTQVKFVSVIFQSFFSFTLNIKLVKCIQENVIFRLKNFLKITFKVQKNN